MMKEVRKVETKTSQRQAIDRAIDYIANSDDLRARHIIILANVLSTTYDLFDKLVMPMDQIKLTVANNGKLIGLEPGYMYLRTLDLETKLIKARDLMEKDPENSKVMRDVFIERRMEQEDSPFKKEQYLDAYKDMEKMFSIIDFSSEIRDSTKSSTYWRLKDVSDAQLRHSIAISTSLLGYYAKYGNAFFEEKKHMHPELAQSLLIERWLEGNFDKRNLLNNERVNNAAKVVQTDEKAADSLIGLLAKNYGHELRFQEDAYKRFKEIVDKSQN